MQHSITSTKMTRSLFLVILMQGSEEITLSGRGPSAKMGSENCNANLVLLLPFCAEHQLVITNTIFRQKNKIKTTWQHPRSKHWHLIDFVIVRARDQGDVQITKSITSADDCWTDHHLVRSSFALKLHHKKRHIGKQPKKRLDVERLKVPALLEELQLALRQSLASVHGNNVEEFWQALKAVILSSSEATIGYRTRKHQDWFDENDYVIEELIDGKRKAFCTWQNDPTNETKSSAYHNIRAEVQRRIRHMKDQWWTAKAEQLQGLADKGDTRGFSELPEQSSDPAHVGRRPLKTKMVLS